MKIKTIGRFTKLPASHLIGHTAIVIDVFRSSTSMICALKNGATKVIPCGDLSEAVNIASRMGGCLLAGERGGVKIPGFDIGNSPLEFDAKTVKDKTVVMNTSNGTAAVCGAAFASKVYIGAMINRTAVAKKAVEADNDIIIICAGTDGEISADDLYAAGGIIEAIASSAEDIELCDLSIICRLIYRSWKENRDEFSTTHHYSKLVNLDMAGDVDYCLKEDETDVVPEYRDGVLEMNHS